MAPRVPTQLITKSEAVVKINQMFDDVEKVLDVTIVAGRINKNNYLYDSVIDGAVDAYVFASGAIIKAGEADNYDIEDCIKEFNYMRGLDKLNYMPKLEVTNVIEECLEILYDTAKLPESDVHIRPDEIRGQALMLSRNIQDVEVPKWDKIRKIMRKLVDYLTGGKFEECLEEVCKQNLSRKGSIVKGKFVKDTHPDVVANYYTPDFVQFYDECLLSNECD